jgi:hypothetical protein
MSRRIAITCALSTALSLVGAHGFAEDSPPTHQGVWPIYNGHNHQPTRDQLSTLHVEDVTPNQAQDVDRLFDQLLSNSERILRQQPALAR